MPIDDPAMLAALASYNDRSRQTRGRVDVVVTILLLIVHGVLAGMTALAPFGAISDDACVYLDCADQPWFSQAVGVAVPATGVVFFADLAVAVLRMVRHKLAFVVPVIGCAVQLALAIAVFTMISEAGLL